MGYNQISQTNNMGQSFELNSMKTKIGDIFIVDLNNGYKRYFQYISNDLTQLNSDVIRVFKTKYPEDYNPTTAEIIEDEILLYAHCVIKLGLKMNFWKHVENNIEIGLLDNIIFRDTNDYGRGINENPLTFSNEWYVWKINDIDFKYVGKMSSNFKNSFVGLVFNPVGIVELIKGNKYPLNYPDIE